MQTIKEVPINWSNVLKLLCDSGFFEGIDDIRLLSFTKPSNKDNYWIITLSCRQKFLETETRRAFINLKNEIIKIEKA